MAKIIDSEGNLLALVIPFESIKEEKYFPTENSQEMQVAAFNLR